MDRMIERKKLLNKTGLKGVLENIECFITPPQRAVKVFEVVSNRLGAPQYE